MALAVRSVLKLTPAWKTRATREPSDGPVGRLIREMLTGQHTIPDQTISQGTFGLLFAADRLDITDGPVTGWIVAHPLKALAHRTPHG